MSTRQLFTFLLFAAMFAFAVRAPQDPDLWWHLKTGAYILENGVPHQDPPWSFTVPDSPWTAHEWLTDVLMIGVYRTSGLVGLGLVFGGLITLAFGLLYLASEGRPYAAGLATFWGIAASLPFLNARPQMLNILFGAAVILVVEQVRRRAWDERWLFALPLITVLWANMHGGFLLGLAIMGVYLAGDALQLYFREEVHDGLDWRQLGFLLLAAGASFLSALANPYGAEMWTYAIRTTLTSEAMREAITEWQSPDFHIWYFWIFGFMVMGTWLAMVFSRRPVSWTDILFVTGTSFAAYQSSRNIPIFVLVAVPLLSRHLLGVFLGRSWYPTFAGTRPPGYLRPPLKRLNLFVAVLAAAGMLLFAVRELGDTDQVVRDSFPVAAVDYLENQGLNRAGIFHEYDWGGYLIWRGVPTFIDGRADMYGDDFIYFYMQTNTRAADWEEPLERYQVDTILTRTEGGLAVLLDLDERWQLTYEDPLARIYRRVAPPE